MTYALTSAYLPELIDMIEFRDYIYLRTHVLPGNIVEIGSGHGQDADTLAQAFGVTPSSVHIFEPHPVLNQQIKTRFPQYETYEWAISNNNRESVPFNAVEMSSRNRAVSSLLTTEQKNATYKGIEVPCRRMDTVLSEIDLATVDVLKLDVEGATHQVLEGFGERLKDVKVMHIECEHIPVWDGQLVFRDVEKLLIENDFVLIHLKVIWPQSDSIWVHQSSYNASLMQNMSEFCAVRWSVPGEPPKNFVPLQSRIDT